VAAWLVGLVLLAPLLAVGGALLAANTEPGRAALARLAGSFVPGLTIEGLEGPLPGRPGLTRLTMADEAGIWLEVEGVRLAWDPLALLRGEARVEALTVRRVALHRLPAGDAAPRPEEPPGPLIPELPSLPVALNIERLEVARIELGEAVAGQAAVLRLSGQARLDPWGLTLALDAGTEDGGTALIAEAALRPGSGRLTAKTVLRGEPGGVLSRLAGLGERPLALDLSLDGPAEGAALRLTAEAGPGLGADLTGTVAAPDTTRLGLAVQGRVDASGLVAGPAAGFAGPLDLRLDAGRMPDGLVEVRELRLAGAAGVVQAEGRVDTAGARSALWLRAALPPSSVFAALLPGDLAGWDAVEAEAEVTGALTAPVVSAQVAPAGFRSSVAPLAALLGPAPRVGLRAQAPGRIELLTLAGQAVQAEVRGAVGQALDLTFAADLAAPDGVVPGLAGALRFSGTATGAASDPTLTVEAQSDRLEAAGRVLEALSLSARVATPATRPQVEARGTGRLQSLPLSLALRGAPEDGGWLRLEAAEAALGPARLTAAGRLHPARLLADGEARLDVPDLAPFAPLLGRPIAGAVRLEARGGLTGPGARRAADAQRPARRAARVDDRRRGAQPRGPRRGHARRAGPDRVRPGRRSGRGGAWPPGAGGRGAPARPRRAAGHRLRRDQSASPRPPASRCAAMAGSRSPPPPSPCRAAARCGRRGAGDRSAPICAPRWPG
jgi:translocation and assembly module TamB